MLRHAPEINFTENGARYFDDHVEREADLLGECLLVPTGAVVPVYRRLRTIDATADHFGVSRELMRKRYNLSGPKQIIERSRARNWRR
jgi:Zn-dependent peptidase ImmA (M78 family)